MSIIKNIDAFDKKIIDLLICSSNISLQDLSRKLQRSKSFVGYRLKNLINNKLIEQIYLIINITKLGFYAFDLYVRTNMDEKKEKEFISSLKSNKNIYYIERLIGNYSMRISYFAKNLDNAIIFMKVILSNYIEEIEDTNLKIIRSIIKTQNPLFSINKDSKCIECFNQFEEINLTKKEIILLRLLNYNPRISILKLSSQSGFSRDFIANAIKKLEKKKIILGYSIDLDTEKLNFISKLFLLKIKFLTKKQFNHLKQYLVSLPEVQTITTYFPDNYLSLEIIFKNDNELRTLQVKLLNQMKKYIDKIEIIDYYDEPKYSCMKEFLESIRI